MDFKNNRFTIITTAIISVLVISFFSFFFLHEIKGSAPNHSVNAAKTVPETEKRVSFVGVGDNLIHDSIYNAADRRKGAFGDGDYDFTSLYSNIKSDIKKYDIRYINEESIIAGDKYGIHTYPKFNAPQAMIPALEDAGFNLINLANNHSMDMGSQAIIDSVNLWDKENVYHTGLYKSQEERDKPLIIDKNGIKIAVLSYTYDTNGMTPDKEYMVPYLNEEKIREDIARAKKESDFILVSAHWGDEHIHNINQTEEKYSKLFNDLGVDAVLGTHAHVIQKAGWMKNDKGEKTLIYFGTGNFVHNMLGADPYLEGMASWDFVKKGNKKYIENAKFTPLVFHLENNQYGLDGSVYRLDRYPVELANRHYAMGGAGQYNIEKYKEMVKSLIPSDMIDMNFDNQVKDSNTASK